MQTAPGGVKKYCRFAALMEANLLEMKQFLGLTLLMGIVRKPTIELYWTKQLTAIPLHTNVFTGYDPKPIPAASTVLALQ